MPNDPSAEQLLRRIFAPDLCPVHGEPWAPTAPGGHRSCLFYIPELGASEDYGCPQPNDDPAEADCG